MTNRVARPATDQSVITAEGLHKTFGDMIAVRDLSFAVEPGMVLGLLGPNGAGKTTTIKMLTTLLPLDDGTATVAGFDVGTQPDQVRQVIGLAGQAAALDDMLTARENLELFGRLCKIPRSVLRPRIDELIERFEMGEFSERPAKTYSGGERRRLDVVASLVANPPALFLDEPTTGLDPRSRLEVWSVVRELAADGTAIVLTTQYLDEADRIADDIVIIDRGAVVAAGTGDELKKDLERDRLEVHLRNPGDVDAALEVLASIAADVAPDREAGLLTVTVNGATVKSLDVLRSLDGAGIALADFQLRRPTLDDVFLTYTADGSAR